MARRIVKRKSPRHGHGRPEQVAKWADHWARFSGNMYRKKSIPRLFERDNPPFQGWDWEVRQ